MPEDKSFVEVAAAITAAFKGVTANTLYSTPFCAGDSSIAVAQCSFLVGDVNVAEVAAGVSSPYSPDTALRRAIMSREV